MRSISGFMKTTLIGGVVVLLPLVGGIYLTLALADIALRLTEPIASLLPMEKTRGVAIANAAVIVLLLVLCFLCGLVVRTAVGRAVGPWLDTRVFSHMPGYELLRRFARHIGGDIEELEGTPVVVRLGDTRQIGLMIERNATGELTVFVPLAPMPSIGFVYIVNAEAVEQADVPTQKVLRCLTEYGVGSDKILARAHSDRYKGRPFGRRRRPRRDCLTRDGAAAGKEGRPAQPNVLEGLGLAGRHEFYGRGERSRTSSPRFWRPVLCQLSYTPACSQR